MATTTKKHEETCTCCGGTVKLADVPVKFWSLISTNAGLFALATDGTVWVYCSQPRYGWKRVAMTDLSVLPDSYSDRDPKNVSSYR